ncbi:MFS transporter [Massilia endophytica]|uniref:MFS transporter n=1 Tax=Massilia endophytica TaxID=2899220 RepID=UPI001E2A9F90|nr:MFS transporter [Massilia endophytica]UGQ47018.1 MFS transporter [Massilia endophytica]
METPNALEFSIDIFKPETIPMSRLAEYMSELAALYGSEPSVHFKMLRSGSAVLEAVVDEVATEAVESRLRLVHDDAAPDDLKRAYQNLNGMLRSDKAVGQIKHPQGAVILAFPGRDTPVQKTYRVKEVGVLDGVVIRIGGKDNTVPVWLKDSDGSIHKCEANSEMARELIKEYLSSPIRVSGQGDWLRGEDGLWTLEKFKITGWESLDEKPIADIVNAARNTKGNGWTELDDPIKEHLHIRGSD